ncbi:SDR family oxidoreductase [Alginatibacterium sediminis]|uniref:SDR family oxidoreductase n=1 Tax=Alginatibacterium sediminis TaxID=2164068 RepID=A0A420EAY2_9ALTE|nr:oxidoreductase [Alginatibacterium sediminis]RKF17813.1 SDR family oxidoreductase [Alginatibacterium sediminis]
MNNLLSAQKVLVLGAGGFLGSKITKKALEQGAQVIAVDLKIEDLQVRLHRQGIDLDDSNVSLFELDVTSEQAVKSFFHTQSGITAAVNCTYPRNKSYGTHFLDVTLESFNENLALHLGSAFLVTQQCAAYFTRNQQAFSLVNISSIYGVVAPKFEIYQNTSMTTPVEYAAIKSAILHLNKYVARYINDSRFRVNSVSPGGILDNQPEPFLEAYKSNTNGTGMLDVDDVVGPVLYLISPQSLFVTGQNLIIDDGFCL